MLVIRPGNPPDNQVCRPSPLDDVRPGSHREFVCGSDGVRKCWRRYFRIEAQEEFQHLASYLRAARPRTMQRSSWTIDRVQGAMCGELVAFVRDHNEFVVRPPSRKVPRHRSGMSHRAWSHPATGLFGNGSRRRTGAGPGQAKLRDMSYRVWVSSAARVVSAVLLIAVVSGSGVGREIAGKGVQAAFPEGAAGRAIHALTSFQGLWVPVRQYSVRPSRRRSSKAGLLENLQMFRDGRQRHRKGFGQFADAGLAGGQTRQNGASGRVRQCRRMCDRYYI